MRQSQPAFQPIAVSMGDPAGIGLDLMLLAWSQREALQLTPWVALADPKLLRERSRLLGLNDLPLIEIDHPSEAGPAFAHGLPVRPLVCPEIEPGQPSVHAATAIIAAIEQAVELIWRGEVCALTTCPIAKKPLYDAGFTHPGHTEFLAALAQKYWDAACHPVMMLAASELKVVPVTVHMPLAQVSSALTGDLIVQTGLITAEALRRDFGIAQPRLAVTGLNPHAGEGGALGTEDDAIVAPAIATLIRHGIAVTGPHPADTIFHAAARQGYDAVLAMYHDQALIPIKTLAFDRGVNVTLGLPFIRTSPDHGTAFSLAGTGQISILSFVEALRLAARMSTARDAAALGMGMARTAPSPAGGNPI